MNLLLAVIPNKKCDLNSKVPLSLDCGIRIGKITNEEYGAACNYETSFSVNTAPAHKCCLIEIDRPEITTYTNDQLLLSLCFSLNFFVEQGSITFSKVYEAKNIRKFRITGKHEGTFKLGSNQVSDLVKLRKEASSDKVEKVLLASLFTLTKDKGVFTTFSRFNAAVSHADDLAKIIDLSICFESLFPFQTEIAYRFRLLGSLIGSDEIGKRKEHYDALKKLYNARSKIVHGTSNTDAAVKEVLACWSTLIEIARYGILYKMSFLADKDLEEWRIHLDELALGLNKDKEDGE